jgi:hypothetical protein
MGTILQEGECQLNGVNKQILVLTMKIKHFSNLGMALE